MSFRSHETCVVRLHAGGGPAATMLRKDKPTQYWFTCRGK